MKEKLRKVLFCICLVVVGVCLGCLAYYYVSVQQNEKIYAQLQTSETYTYIEPTPAETEDEKIKIPVNFEELQQINPEIYAWIQIPGTEVNYPVVQSAVDNHYYLEHTIEGIAGYPGSIYTEGVNSKDFSDYNTLIYGHDMEDGSMFGGLHQFSDEDYLRTHETLVIYTQDHQLTYRIFRALNYDDRHIIGSFDFTDAGQRQAFLDSIGNDDPKVTADSRLVTLSTCIASQPNQRFLVEAVLIDEK